MAPSAAVNQSTSDSISAHWPGRSVARSTAAAQEAGSGHVEFPVNRPDNEAKQVRLTQQRGPVQYYGDNFIGLNDQPPHILKVLHVRDAQILCASRCAATSKTWPMDLQEERPTTAHLTNNPYQL